MSKNLIITAVVAVVVLAAIINYYPKFMTGKFCNGGDCNGKSEQTQTAPLTSKDGTAGLEIRWETRKDTIFATKFEYKRPVDWPYHYINLAFQGWPPEIIDISSIEPTDPVYCKEIPNSESELGYVKREKVTIEGNIYCVTTIINEENKEVPHKKHQSHQYSTIKDNLVVTLGFDLEYINCSALGELGNTTNYQVKECKIEQNTFDPNKLADQILSTFKFID